MIGFRNVDMAELRIHTPAERVAIAEGHLFRVAFAIFFQLSQVAEFQDVPLFPGVFFFPATRSVYDAVLTWIFRVLILLSPLSGFQPPSSVSFGSRRRPQRDRGGVTGTVAASPGFRVMDGSPPGRRQLRWLRSRQPAPPGGRPGKAQAEEEQDRQESGQQ